MKKLFASLALAASLVSPVQARELSDLPLAERCKIGHNMVYGEFNGLVRETDHMVQMYENNRDTYLIDLAIERRLSPMFRNIESYVGFHLYAGCFPIDENSGHPVIELLSRYRINAQYLQARGHDLPL